jgi:hypothetical protein
MIDNNAQYSGLANIMNMRDRNPNTQLAYVPNGYLNSVPTAPNPYTGIPQVNSPIAMNEGGMPSQQYPMQEEAGELADRGRYGDTTLVHMTPGEVRGLASLGQLTINPDTGLPEAFNMKSLLPIIGGIAGSFLLPGVGTALGASALGATAIGAGLGTTAGGLLAGQSFGEAALGGVMSGAMSFGMGSLMGAGDVAGALQPTTDFVPPPIDTSAIPASYQGLAGQAGQVADFGSSAIDMGLTSSQAAVNIPGVTPTSVLQAPAGSMIGTADVAPKTLAGFEISSPVVKGQVYNPSQLLEMGVTPSTATTMEIAKQKLSDPLTYAPLAAGAVTGAFDDPYEYEEPAARPAPDTGFGRYTLAGGEVKRPVATEEELRRRALEGGSQNYFTPYNYVRNAAEGGIVGLQQGGMATPQAPSAMSAMLNTPTAQQPIPINIAVQPPQQQQQPMQQPMPMQGMGQPPQQGIQPLPDQSIEFKKNMDMEEQLQKQKTATSIQGQSALLGLIGGAGDYLQSQGMNYPTTTPSGTIPQTPAMNQGAQVNMGASGGFAQGGIINRADGGPTRQQFNDFMKNISNTPAGLLMRVSGLDKQFESQLSQGNAGSGAESMNQLLSRNAYSNNAGSSAAAPVQSEGGAASMNQLLSNPSYSKQLAMGGLLGYNEGGMPSQEQRYFEGQVVGKGDGQSDEVPFSVDGGEVDMAMLSPDEYVLAADVVSYIGDGSSNAGAAKLDQFMEDVREQAHGSDKQINGFDERGLANLVA